ncbi:MULTISPECIES: hypothetical protein [Nostocales]|uniref:Type II secretion system protein GspC N-terminal domain-containing protein n=3 Tax=Nostocales TaxID=1161 RepID=A0A0C1N271_9CYAN|nr:hypothetical protein [Tolypothrix bouteillei]KAF3883993.1 hypothetical protein DA73_0400040610 [Tolypothrix bouteillei VB521301]
MSEKASTYLILSEPSEDLIVSEQPWSIETYADGLMDELFAEIDDILDGQETLPSQTVQHGGHFHRVQTITIPQIVFQDRQIPQTQPIPKVRHNPLSTVVVGATATNQPPPKPSKQKSRSFLSSVLWLGVGVGAAMACLAWLSNSGLVNRLASTSLQKNLLPQQVQPKLPTKAQVEEDLVRYMLGALSAIDRQETTQHLRSTKPATVASVPSNQANIAYQPPAGNLLIPAANNTSLAPGRSTTVVERRIYIPVYQAPQPMRYAPPPMLANLRALPQVPVAASPKKNLGYTSKLAPVKTAAIKTQLATKPMTVTALAAVRNDIKPVAMQTKPVTVYPVSKAALPILSVTSSNSAPPKSPTATAPTSTTPIAEQEIVATVSAPNRPVSAHTLEGLMELGNKSAALFKINGVTKRVEVGEAIGYSGWTLVEVTNGEAVIRRNGEVRSIYAGQTF